MPWIGFFAAACLVQVAYWLVLGCGFRRARRRDAAPSPAAAPPPVSVVVAARDEEADLPALLGALARQTHPRFEVVVVDDASADRTADVVRASQDGRPEVRLVQVTDPQPPRKKRALARGIAAARYDLLAFTDADCTPPPEWLSVLAARHAAAAAPTVFVGHGPFRRRAGVLNAFARYETLVAAFFAAATAGLGRAYMAVGRNISYPRTVFDAIDGFTHSLHSMSGDDDLLVQEVVRRRAADVRFVFDPRTFVPSEAKRTWGAWLRQKMRHTSAGRFYGRGVQAHLALFHGTAIALWFAPLLAGWGGAVLLAVRLLVQAAVLYGAAGAFGERRLLTLQPLWELLYALYNLSVAPLGAIRTPGRW